MTRPTQTQIKAAAISLCKSWPKNAIEGTTSRCGCAALCMDRLGEIPKTGCAHAVVVHGKRAAAALTAAAEVREPDSWRTIAFEKEREIMRQAEIIAKLRTEVAIKAGWMDKKAEIAAAETSKSKVVFQSMPDGSTAVLETAVAEVGPAKDTPYAAAYSTGYDKGFENAIERCAQILDEKARRTKTNAKVAYEDGAAAIRAMKDQP